MIWGIRAPLQRKVVFATLFDPFINFSTDVILDDGRACHPDHLKLVSRKDKFAFAVIDNR